MSRFILALPLLSLALCGCHNDDSTSVSQMYQTPIESQPIVAVVPVIDNTKISCDWNLSDELSSAIYAHLAERDHLRLVSSSKVRLKTKPLLEKNNPFDADISWIKKSFREEEFVVFLELVEHEEVLADARKKKPEPANSSAELRMSLRIRAFDLRGNEPVVVLQELASDAYFIHPQFNQVNFYQVSWKDPTFEMSPMGLAHERFTKEIARRIDDYILLALKK
jgi:hypothetical protein